jgi:hypothetical protein
MVRYKDGTRATMLLMNGLVGDFNFAAKLKGQVHTHRTHHTIIITDCLLPVVALALY